MAVVDFSQVVTPGTFSETYLLDEEGVYHVSVTAGGDWEFDGPAKITRGAGSWSQDGSYSAKLNKAYSFSSAAVETVELHGYLKKEGGKGPRPEYTADFNFDNCYIKSTSPVESEISVSIPYASDATFVSIKNEASAAGHNPVPINATWTLSVIEDGGNIPQELIDGKTADSITVGSGAGTSKGPLYPGKYEVTARWGTSISDSMLLIVGPSVNIIGYRRISGDAVSEGNEEDPLNLIVPINDDNDDMGKVPYHDNADAVKGDKDDDFFMIKLASPKMSTGTLTLEAPEKTRIFIGKKLLENYSVDLASPEGDLAPLADGTDVLLYVESLDKSADAEFKYTYAGEFTSYDSLHVMMTRADADVDSDNNNNLDAPKCDQLEDDREYARLDSDILEWPGKIFKVNNEDLDNDGIPDFADGFNPFEDLDDDETIRVAGPLEFIPLVVLLPEHLDTDKVRFTFEYTASKPDDVKKTEVGRTEDNKPIYEFSAPAGFRIWKTNGTIRKKTSVQNSGDFVPASAESDIVKLTPAQIGMSGKTATLYVEATPGAESLADYARLIRLKVYTTNYPENEYVLDDTVRLNPILMEFILKGEKQEKLPSNFVGTGFPRPEVILDTVNTGDVSIQGNSKAVVEIKGKVYDPVADNLPESVGRIDKYQVYVNGESVHNGKISIKSPAGDFWKNKPYLGEINPIKVSIPLSYEGAYSIKVFSSKSASGMVAYDEVNVTLARKGEGLQKEKWEVIGVENRIGSANGSPLQTSFRLKGLRSPDKYLCKLGDNLKYEFVEQNGYLYPKHEFPLIMSFYQPYFEDGSSNNENTIKCIAYDPVGKKAVSAIFNKNVAMALIKKETQDKPLTLKKGNFAFADLAVDGNKDGNIDFMDNDDKEYLFWVNDDNDKIRYNENMWQEDDFNENNPNCENNKIDCLRDLEDFERLHFIVPSRMANLLDAGPYGPKLAIVADNGLELNLFPAVNEEKDYVTDKTIASSQANKERLVSVTNKYEPIDKSRVQYGKLTPFIFEGKHEGDGTVYLQVRMNNMVVCNSPLVMKLGNIKSFYRCFKTGINGQMLDDNVAGTYVERETPIFNYNARNNNELAIFVHGWNIEAWESERWAETMFKRLWHQDYEGQVAIYLWPCLTHSRMIPPRDNFDRSEYRGWQSGTVLKDLLVNLRKNRNLKLSLLAHSQGNVVVGESLKSYDKSGLVDNYVASQAALSAHFYDNKLNQAAIFPGTTGPETPNVIGFYFSGKDGGKSEPYLKSVVDGKVSQKFVRYYNEEDYAFQWKSWHGNNCLKPDSAGLLHLFPWWIEIFVSPEKDLFYGYSGKVDEYRQGKDRFYWNNPVMPFDQRILVFPKDRYEIFAFCAESRNRPVGTVTQSILGFDCEFDLISNLHYDEQHYSHSKEFRSNIINELDYWKQFLSDIK